MNPLHKSQPTSRPLLDFLANRGTIGVLRCLLTSQHTTLSTRGIAQAVGITEKSAQGRLDVLERMGLAKDVEGKGRRSYRVDESSPMAEPLFEVFNLERYARIDPFIRSEIESVVDHMDKDRLVCAIIFGSRARGIAALKSDVDVIVVHTGRAEWDIEAVGIEFRLSFVEIPVDLHLYNRRNFQAIPNLAVLDAIITGISVRGHRYLFERRCALKGVPKSAFTDRLATCRRLLKSSENMDGVAKDYLVGIVEVALTQMETVLTQGHTISRREMTPKGRYRSRIGRLEQKLTKQGDLIALD